MLKDDEVRNNLKKLGVDGDQIKSKFRIDEFDLEQRTGFEHNLSNDLRNSYINVSEQSDEMRELVDTFGI